MVPQHPPPPLASASPEVGSGSEAEDGDGSTGSNHLAYRAPSMRARGTANPGTLAPRPPQPHPLVSC